MYPISRLLLGLVLVGGLTTVGATPAWAQPFKVNYSIRLTGASGEPLAGTIHVRIQFFKQASGGTALTAPLDFLDQPIIQGFLNLDIDLDAAEYHAAFNGTNETWIEVEDVTRGKKYPRQKFGAVPYALKVPVDGWSIGWNAAGELELIGGGGGGGGPIDATNITSGVIDTARLPTASAGATGILSATDWNTFNNKQPAIAAGTPSQYWRGDKTFRTLDTLAVTENPSALYFTDDRARTAAVENAIDAGKSTVAPSQAAVHGALQALDTSDINEDPSALYFTEARARDAAVEDSINDGITNVAPSQNAVFDALTQKQNITGRNAANGYAGLDGSGKIDPTQLPYAGLTYRGVWNAATNTPPLPSSASCSLEGEYYIVDVGGSTDLDGISTWSLGDWVICSANDTWQRVGSSSGVTTVNSKTGSTITLLTDDISDAGSTNKYFTNALARAALSGTGAINYNDATGVISISAATTAAPGSMSAADKIKLDGISGDADDVNSSTVAATGAVMDSDYTGNGILARNGAAGSYTLVTNNAADWNQAFVDRLKWDGGSDDLDAATGRTSLGLVPGTHVQAYDQTLAGIAALAPSANQLIYANGNDTFATTALSVAGRNVIGAADAAAQRSALGVEIGSAVMAHTAPGASGNVLTSNGTTWTSAAPPSGASLQGIMQFNSNGTFIVPAGVTKVFVELWGGGGGGAKRSTEVGASGGTSSFGAYVSATGGTGGTTAASTTAAGGSGVDGDINFTGGVGAAADLYEGSPGGGSPRGGAGGGGNYYVKNAANGTRPGGGGGGAGDSYLGSGGGGGGYAAKIITGLTPGASVPVTVGAGGAGGGGLGGNGAAGSVIVSW